VRTKLRDEMHDAREVALVVIGLLVPFQSVIEVSNYAMFAAVKIGIKTKRCEWSTYSDMLHSKAFNRRSFFR
jgi:hypothetical protein